MKTIKFICSLGAFALIVFLTACNKTEDLQLSDTVTEKEITQEETASNTQVATDRATDWSIKFGMPVGEFGCFLVGICSIESTSNGTPNDGTDTGVVPNFNSDGDFQLGFPEPDGHPELAGEFFEMAGDYTITNELASALGGEAYTILAGRYPINTVGNVKMVTFPRE